MILDGMPGRQLLMFCLILLAHGASSSGSRQPGVTGLGFAGAWTFVMVPNRMGDRFREVPAHREFVDAFRSVPHWSPAGEMFTGRGGKLNSSLRK